MSLRIRLSRVGKKNRPFFRIVVTELKSHQKGRTVDTVGFYDPRREEIKKFDKIKIDHWRKAGAKLSSSVAEIVTEGEGLLK